MSEELLAQKDRQIEALERALEKEKAKGRDLKARLRVAQTIGKVGSEFVNELYQLARENEDLRAERDQARDSLSDTKTAIREVGRYTEELYEIARKDAEQLMSELATHFSKGDVSHTAMHLYAVSSRVQRLGDALENRSIQMFTEQSKYTDVSFDPRPYLLHLRRLMFLTGVWEVSLFDAIHAYELSDHPGYVASDILYECRVLGEPRIETLERLSVGWIEENLPDPPKKYTTLQEGLKIFQAMLDSNLNQTQYHARTGTPERTLRKYQDWFDKLTEAKKSKPAFPETEDRNT
jgi:hypothetical protein